MLGRWPAFDRWRAGALGGLGVALVVASCREPTQITLELSTDVPCANVNDTTVGVGTQSSVKSKPPLADQKGCKSSSGRIGSLVVVPSGEKDDEVTLQVVTGVNGQQASGCDPVKLSANCIVARRALRFVPHTSLELPIELSASCLGKVCPDPQTCFDGACVSAKIVDPESCTTPGGCSAKPDAGTDAQLDTEAEADASLDPSLIANFSFDGPPGVQVTDDSGHGNFGTPMSASVSSSGGHSGGGLVLGASGTFAVGPSASLGAITQLSGATIAAWVLVNANPNNQGFIFDHDPFGVDDLEAWLNGSLSVCVDSIPSPPHTLLCSSPGVPNLGVWTHVAFTADAKGTNVYVNGAVSGSSTTPAPVFALDKTAYFGLQWDGVMDDIRIYNRVLSQLEIASLASQ